jgi:cytidyltransferase-like protein
MIKKVYTDQGQEISLAQLINRVTTARTVFKAVMSSGYFAPIHSGHIEYLKESSKYGCAHIVVINDDEALKAKKGFVALSESERAAILYTNRYVDYVIVWSGSSVADCIREVKPAYFTNGGDRSTVEVLCSEEIKACDEVGCQLLLGVGGTHKSNSSSIIIENIITNAPRKDIIDCRN